ncbi:MAG TPA: hypothetical protein VH164_04330 [Ktedonobacteraceae bacterium]|jgi:hypothetical protein|nr:hypothetical protein [Ktedonobacteraceae bacterium]
MDTNISLHDLSSIQAKAEAEEKQCLARSGDYQSTDTFVYDIVKKGNAS